MTDAKLHQRRMDIDELIARHQADQSGGVLRGLGRRDDGPHAVELRRPAGAHDVPPCDFHRFSMQLSGRQDLISFEMDQTRQPAPAAAMPGTVSFIPVGQPLCAATAGDDFHAFQILIPRKHMRRAVEQVRGVDACDEAALLGHIGTATSRLYRLAHLALDEYREPGPGDVAMIDALVQAICVELARDFAARAPNEAKVSPMSEAVRARVLSLMEVAVDGSICLGNIAEELGLEPYRLSRLFQASFGETPRQHLMRLRMARARRMLRETNAPLAQIAAECGFSSQAHMTTSFSQQIGTTPARYRARFANVA